MKIRRETLENGAIVEHGHTFDEYEELYGLSYENGDLWDFSRKDLEDGSIEPQKDMVYWSIKDLDGEERLYETELKESCESKKESKEDLDEEKLEEGTSNFGTGPDNFPLLVFYTWEEVDYNCKNDLDYPNEEDYYDEDDNFNEDAYFEACEEFEEKYWDELDVCCLDEDQVERLEEVLDKFNDETLIIADKRYDEEPDDYYNLKAVEVKVEPGYYEAAYIDVEHEDYLEDLSEGFIEEQHARFENLFKKLKEEFHLTQLSAGPMASDGTRGYSIIKDSLEEKPLEEKKKKDKGIVATGYDLEKSTKFMNHMLGSDTMTCEDYDDLDKYDLDSYIEDDDVCVYLFPEGTTKDDVDVATSKFKLKYLGKVEDNQEDRTYIDTALMGKYKDLKRFGDEHLGGYQMHPDFIWKKEEWEDFGPIPFEEDLNEGYVGQTVEDFLGIVILPENIETLIISNIDADDYEETFNGKYEDMPSELNDYEYADFDVGGEKLVVDVSSDDDAYGDDYYSTLGDLLEDYNGDEVCVYNTETDEYIFDGDKSEIEEDILEMRFVSIENPKYLCVNAHCGDSELGIGDIDDMIDSARDEFDESLKEENKKFALIVNGEWYSTYDSYEKADEAREKFLDSCSNEDDAREYYGECPNIDIREIDESLEESAVDKKFSKKDANAIVDWWKEVEDANEHLNWGFKIDNGDYTYIEGMHMAMFDMLDDLVKLKDDEKAKELVKKGKPLYNKYAISKYNESLEEEKLEENKTLDKLADDIDALLKKEGIPSPYIDITNDECVDVGASDEEHLEKIKKVLIDNGYSHFEDISGGAPKYYGVRIEFDAGPTHGYVSVEDYQRSQEILDEMSALRKAEDEEGSKLLKAWAIENTMSHEEFKKKSDKLHKETQEKVETLYKELHELTLRAEEARGVKSEALEEDVDVEKALLDKGFEKGECEHGINSKSCIYQYKGTGYFPEVVARLQDKFGKFDYVSEDKRIVAIKQKDESLKEDSHQEELGLPKEVTFSASEVALDTDDEDPSERLGDLLSDKYGFCHFGFNYEVKKNENGEPSEFRCYDIDWDTSDEELEKGELESLEEKIEDDKPYYYIKFWEDEERRDQGESDIFMQEFETKEEAIKEARKLVDRDGFASVEVFYTPKGDVNENDDELVFGYDGVEVWKESLDKKVNEDVELEETSHNVSFRTYKEMNEKMTQFLLSEGLSQEEVDTLKSDIGGNALHQKIVELGYREEFFNDKKREESHKEWSIKADPLKEEITILVKNNDVWEEFAQVENCPTKDMLEEDIIKEYTSLVEKVLQEEKLYGLFVVVKDANGKIVKDKEKLDNGSKKEMEEKKKHLEEVSPEDSNHNRNFYSIKEL